MASPFSLTVLSKCLLRSTMLNVDYNNKGLQNIGFLYAIQPGLRAIYSDDLAYAEACKRYSMHFNCHPAWGPFLVGAFLKTEYEISNAKVSQDFVTSIQSPTLNALSAIGDSFFNGSLNATLALVFSILVASGLFNQLFFLCFALIFLSIVLRFVGFAFGLRSGLRGVMLIRKLDLVNKGGMLKLVNAFLLCCFFSLILDYPHLVYERADLRELFFFWIIPIGSAVFFSYTVNIYNISRVMIVAVGLAGLAVAAIILNIHGKML